MSTKNSNKPTGAKLPKELEDRLTRAAKESGISKSRFLIKGLELVVREYEETGRVAPIDAKKASGKKPKA